MAAVEIFLVLRGLMRLVELVGKKKVGRILLVRRSWTLEFEAGSWDLVLGDRNVS